MLWMGEFDKLQGHHTSPPSFLHLLFTPDQKKHTTFLMSVLLLHVQSPPIQQEYHTYILPHIYPATVYFCLPKVLPAFWKEATFPLKGRTEQLQNKANQQHPTCALWFQQAVLTEGIIWWPQKTQTVLMHSSMSNHRCPGPACGHRAAFLVVWAIFIPALGKPSLVLTLSC